MQFTTLLWLPVFSFVLESSATTTTHDVSLRSVTPLNCTHDTTDQSCWSQGASIATDFDLQFPTTGKTVTYDLDISNSTCDPDGHGARICMLINGQYPGPTLRANWGDYMVVNVKNSMQDNGTTIHFHGVRQYHTPSSDGVPGITECPLAPGRSRTYAFNVTQFGTSWYHSHYSSQYGDGVAGALVFEGPASANYDFDLGPYPVNEWYYRTAWQENALAIDAIQDFSRATAADGSRPAAPPPANNELINGTNKAADGAGEYNRVTVQSGKRYRLRIISMAVDNYLRLSLDGHPFEIIASDFVPIKPIKVDWIFIGAGQRYDVIITANQKPGNYWFRSNVAKECRNNNLHYGRAIWTYSDVDFAIPNSTTTSPEPTNCVEPGPLEPYWRQAVPESTFQQQVQDMYTNLTRAVVTPGGDNIVVWALHGNIDVDWEKPTMTYVREGNTSYPRELNVLPAVEEGGWNYWLIQQADGIPPIPHPIHLHGHDFFVLGQGNSTYNSSAVLNFKNPTRRDTATIYGNGWLAVAFRSNNPGTWLMHCHIAWHISEGFGMQFLEAPSQITLPEQSAYDAECAAWTEYYANAYYKKVDSGV